MSDTVELSLNSDQINRLKVNMMEYLTLGKTICKDDTLSLGYVKDVMEDITYYLVLQKTNANNFISIIDNVLNELMILESQCIRKWNETNLTKEGTEGLCQEQSVS